MDVAHAKSIGVAAFGTFVFETPFTQCNAKTQRLGIWNGSAKVKRRLKRRSSQFLTMLGPSRAQAARRATHGDSELQAVVVLFRVVYVKCLGLFSFVFSSLCISLGAYPPVDIGARKLWCVEIGHGLWTQNLCVCL